MGQLSFWAAAAPFASAANVVAAVGLAFVYLLQQFERTSQRLHDSDLPPTISLTLPPLGLILIYGLLIAKKGYQRPLSANWLLCFPLSLPPCLLHSRKLIFPGNFTHCELRRRWPVANAPLTTLTAAQATARGAGEWEKIGRGRGQLGMGTASAVDSMRR